MFSLFSSDRSFRNNFSKRMNGGKNYARRRALCKLVSRYSFWRQIITFLVIYAARNIGILIATPSNPFCVRLPQRDAQDKSLFFFFQTNSKARLLYWTFIKGMKRDRFRVGEAKESTVSLRRSFFPLEKRFFSRRFTQDGSFNLRDPDFSIGILQFLDSSCASILSFYFN